MMRNNKGVTLIVLIVIIVLLLMISGITFSGAINTGIIDNTNKMSQEAEINNLKENLKADFLAEKNKTGSREISYEQVEAVLKRNISSDYEIIKDEETREIKAIKTPKGYEITISEIQESLNDANITLKTTI